MGVGQGQLGEKAEVVGRESRCSSLTSAVIWMLCCLLACLVSGASDGQKNRERDTSYRDEPETTEVKVR
jgi:hypothetical protein